MWLIWLMKTGGINLVLKQLILTLLSCIFNIGEKYVSSLETWQQQQQHVLIIVYIGVSTRPQNSAPHPLSCKVPLPPFFRQSSKSQLVKEYKSIFIQQRFPYTAKVTSLFDIIESIFIFITLSNTVCEFVLYGWTWIKCLTCIAVLIEQYKHCQWICVVSFRVGTLLFWGNSLPFLSTPSVWSKSKRLPLPFFLIAIQIGACKLYEPL